MQSYVNTFRHLWGELFGPDEQPIGYPLEEIIVTESRLGTALPTAVRAYLHCFAATEHIHSCYNRFYEPSRIQRDGDMLVLMEENQGVVSWAISMITSAPDPVVFQGTATPDEPVEWHSEELPFSRFMEVWLTWQILNGASPGADCLDMPLLPSEIRTWPVFVDHNGLRVYRRDTMLVGVLEGSETVLYAARTPADIAQLNRLLAR